MFQQAAVGVSTAAWSVEHWLFIRSFLLLVRLLKPKKPEPNGKFSNRLKQTEIDGKTKKFPRDSDGWPVPGVAKAPLGLHLLIWGGNVEEKIFLRFYS